MTTPNNQPVPDDIKPEYTRRLEAALWEAGETRLYRLGERCQFHYSGLNPPDWRVFYRAMNLAARSLGLPEWETFEDWWASR